MAEIVAYIGATGIEAAIGKEGNKYSPALSLNPFTLYNNIMDAKKAADNFDKNLPTLSSQVKNANELQRILSQAGFSGELNEWAMAMSMLETGNLKSPPTKWNNYSNIAYTPHSPYQSGKGYKDWAAYKTPLDWAKDLKRVLSLANVKTKYGPGGPAAIDAGSLGEFVSRLKANGYFGNGNEQLYYRALDMIVKAKQGYKADVANYEKVTKTKVDLEKGSIKDARSWWEKLEWYEKGGIIALAGLITVVAVKS